MGTSAENQIKKHRLLVWIIAFVAFFSVIGFFGRSTEKDAYEAVIATMSLKKAEQFLNRYPKSQFRNRLLYDIIGWCHASDDGKDCFLMISKIIPEDFPEYGKMKAYPAQ